MASAVSRPMGEQAPATTFSYAQAAKGRTASVAPTSTPQSSQAASGANTPLRDTTSSSNVSVNATQAGGESESSKIAQGESRSSNGVKAAQPASESGSKSSQANALSSPSSPSFGTASTSTLPKEEDITSFPSNSATDGVWERRPNNSSSTVNTGDRYVEASEGRRGKGKKASNSRHNKDSEKKDAGKENEPVKPELPLVPAAMPAVNIWSVRKEALAKSKPAVPVKAETPTINGFTPAAKPDQKRRVKSDESEKQGQTGSGKEASKAQKKSSDVRREEPAAKRAAPRGGRVAEKDEKAVPTPLPPSVTDAASWPTPDTVGGEEKRKGQEKTVKDDENDDSSNKEKRPKEQWKKLEYTPSAVFSTPINRPTRGARGGGGRGGRDTGGRGAHLSNGGEKTSTSVAQNVASNEGKDQRGRDNASAGRAASLPPQTSKRASSDDPHASRDQRKQSNAHEKTKQNAPQSAKFEQPPFNSESRRPSLVPVNGSGFEFHPGAEFHQAPGPHMDGYVQPLTAGRDRRSDSNARSVDGYNGAGHTSQRGGEARGERGGRFGRGRGNQNGFANGQGHLPGTFPNGHAMQMPNGFPTRQQLPYSPPLNQTQFGTGYGAPSRGRGGRGQSMGGNVYGRFNGTNGQQMPPIQTGGPIFGFQGVDPLSAPPFNPYVDQLNMVSLVRAQLDYYFSIDNLCKDVYLRKHMDGQGFVYLSFIATFSRMQKLTPDLELIRLAAEGSEIIELALGSDDVYRLRARNGWEQWVMPIEQRDPGSKNAGPKELKNLQLQRQPQSAMLPGNASFSPNGMEPVFQPFSMQQTAMPAMNGHANGVTKNQESPLSAAVPNFAPGLSFSAGEAEALQMETTFSDDEIKGLHIVISNPSLSLSRTFSNGSIDAFQDQESRQGPSEVIDTSDSSTPSSTTTPPGSQSSTYGNGPLWRKGQTNAVPLDSQKIPGREDTLYTAFRARCLRHRDAAHLGHTDHDMETLYEFWSHFLIRNFNPGMYAEFRDLAREDAYQRQTNVGIRNLITYYDELLNSLNSQEKIIPEILADHYVQLVKQGIANGDRSGFDKLRTALRNGALDIKSRKRIDSFVDAQLKEELER